MKERKTIIISAFPGCGKTWCCKNLYNQYKMLDSDSSHFSKHSDFPENYIKHIKENLGKYDFIFVSTHKEVREALAKEKIPYYLVYPNDDTEVKILYVINYYDRGNDAGFVQKIASHWEEWLGDCFIDNWPIHIILNRDQTSKREYLSDVIKNLL